MSKDIIKLIKTKESWDSKELVKAIKKLGEDKIKIKFCHIGGYELLMDGTQTEIVKSLKQLHEFLKSNDIEYDKTITDPYALAESVEPKWNEHNNDGGGSGWIEM